MILVGLTGGIGAGKSTVSAMLTERGAVVIDADAIAREVQQAGSPVLAAMAERFGGDVIAADGSLDRAAVAAIVFSDPEALGDLNRIVHPAIGREVNRRIEAELGTDHVVVLDIPLLTENPARRPRGDDRRRRTGRDRRRSPRAVPGNGRGGRQGPHRPAGDAARSGSRRQTG